MRPFDRTCAVGLLVVTTALVVGVIGFELAGVASAFAGIDVIALQVLEDLTRLLDRVADFLAQLNRVLSEFAQLFGEGGGGN